MIGDCACFQVKGAGGAVHIWVPVDSDVEKEAVCLAAETAPGAAPSRTMLGCFRPPAKGQLGVESRCRTAKSAAGQQAVPPYSLRQPG